MPYHVGGHKPKAPTPHFRFRLKQRLWILVLGVVLALSGFYRFHHSRFIGTNYLGQPVYSPSLIGIGIAVGMCALVPSSWLNPKRRR